MNKNEKFERELALMIKLSKALNEKPNSDGKYKSGLSIEEAKKACNQAKMINFSLN